MPSIADLIPAGLAPSTAEVDALLELAYLVTAVDGRLADEELAALGVLAGRLLGKPKFETRDLDALVERFAHNVEESEIEARVRELAPSLPKALHEVAYNVALGLAFVDHDPARAEDRLHRVLADSLGLSEDRRAALAHAITLDGKKAT
jgi:tellurite resistance protein